MALAVYDSPQHVKIHPQKKLYNLLNKNIFQTWNLRNLTLRETVMTIQGPKYSTESEIHVQLSRFTRKC